MALSAPAPSPLDTSRPFTTAQACAAGLDPRQLRGRDFRRLAKGKYVAASRPDDRFLHTEAVLLGHPSKAFASHWTAARFYRFPVSLDPGDDVSVLDPAERRRRTGVRSHVVPAETQVLEYDGVRIASPAYVFLQLAAHLPLVELVVVGDFLVARGWYTPEGLLELCRRSRAPHAGRARRAARFVRRGVDSPMETRLRMLLVLAGFPEPEVNHLLVDAQGVVQRRFDLCYPGVRVLVEYDGRHHVELVDQWDSDIDRREELDDDAWRIIVVTSKGVYVEPERTLDRVRKVLRARGMTGLPTTYGREWRRHFPGRAASPAQAG
jgi:very-short-patch-repair endonuclease